MGEIEFSIVRHIGVIGESAKGWKRELNLVSWNKRDAKLDVRDWDSDHLKMGKGITLSPDEGRALAALLVKELGQ